MNATESDSRSSKSCLAPVREKERKRERYRKREREKEREEERERERHKHVLSMYYSRKTEKDEKAEGLSSVRIRISFFPVKLSGPRDDSAV